MATATKKQTTPFAGLNFRISGRKDGWGMLMADGRAIGLVRKPAIMRPEYTADQVCRVLQIGRDRLAEMVAARD
jgi:hypothetical protein